MEAQGIREVVTYSISSRFAENDGDEETSELIAVPIADEQHSFERLQAMWSGVLGLSIDHRKALLLNLKYKGNDLLRALPVCGIARVREIARALEFTDEQLADIWPTLPWDDLRIAEHLGITRQQVINLRQTARVRLHRAMGGHSNIK